MKILSASNDRTSLLLEPREQRCLINALGEVCHTFEIPDFSTAIGIEHHAAERLLSTVNEAYNESQPIRVELTRSELMAIRNALRITMREINDWEFNTRVGVTRKEWQDVLHEIGQVV